MTKIIRYWASLSFGEPQLARLEFHRETAKTLIRVDGKSNVERILGSSSFYTTRFSKDGRNLFKTQEEAVDFLLEEIDGLITHTALRLKNYSVTETKLKTFRESLNEGRNSS